MGKHKIGHLIFDLGDVIIDLDVGKTVDLMAQLMGKTHVEALRIFRSDDCFNQFEKGEISTAEFRDVVRQFIPTRVDDMTIDSMWNAMLLNIPVERIDLLKKLKRNYTLYLLSNTNAIHINIVNEKLKDHSITSFNELFQKVYYSHEIGMRKPDREIYKFVLADQNLKASETLFFDDNIDNIEGAREIGINTFHVTDPSEILTFFNE